MTTTRFQFCSRELSESFRSELDDLGISYHRQDGWVVVLTQDQQEQDAVAVAYSKNSYDGSKPATKCDDFLSTCSDVVKSYNGFRPRGSYLDSF